MADSDRRAGELSWRGIETLRESMPELARKIGALPWVADGVEHFWEGLAIRALVLLADVGYTEELIELPWVVEGRNHLALYSLRSIEGGLPGEYFDRVVSHPTVTDGITDQEAKIIAALVPDAVLDPVLLDKLLDPEQVSLEERTVTLPLAGETELAIIRTRPGNDYTMDTLERAVSSIEEFMGLAFPGPGQPVLFWFEESPFQGRAAKLSTHVSILEDERNMGEGLMLGVVAHESSHYYWGYDTVWISEGAASFMESIVMNTVNGPLGRPPCSDARSIAEFEDLERDPTVWDACPYSLGERLFRDLYRNMDDTTFRLAFRRLYLHTQFDLTDDQCTTAETTICHVREAFSAYAPEGTSAAVEKVIARWYDGIEPYDLSWIDDSPVEADIAAIDGRIEGAYLSLSAGGPPISTVVGEPGQRSGIFLNLDYSFQNFGDLDSLPIEISLYFEDGFEFHRTQTALPLPNGRTRSDQHIWLPQEGAPGRYWVQAYWGEQKIAEATFAVVPDHDRRNIRGVVTGIPGQSIEKIAVSANRGEERFRVEAGNSGTYSVEVPFGSYVLEVSVLIGAEWRVVGWYDGSGGITTDPSQAVEVIVDTGITDSIVIRLPAIPDASIRGVITGPDGRPRSETIWLVLVQGSETRIEPVRGGAFNIVVSPGSYVLEVRMNFGYAWRVVGWYDGSGGITTGLSEAAKVIVYGEDVEDIEIRLPAVDYRSIRGAVTFTGGPPLGDVGLWAKQGDTSAHVQAGADGAFVFVVFSGSYVLDIRVLVGSEWHFVGWYDGSGGITTDPSQAFEVVVGGADVEGIEITLPVEGLLCPAWSWRSPITGRCR